MNKEEIFGILKRVSNPLIHAITNPISINQCANAVLAVGARPIMAEHPKEVAEITKTAGAVLLNLGNITDVRKKSMLISIKTAKKNAIPVVLDAVGVACSGLRRDYAMRLMKKYTPDVIKGNYSEIFALARCGYKSCGVDADFSLEKQAVITAAAELSERYNCTVLASGRTDIIVTGKKATLVTNGSSRMSEVTGTGCMLGAITAVLLTVADAHTSAACATVILDIAGELSERVEGSGSFIQALMDSLSTMSRYDIEERCNMEEIQIEKA